MLVLLVLLNPSGPVGFVGRVELWCSNRVQPGSTGSTWPTGLTWRTFQPCSAVFNRVNRTNLTNWAQPDPSDQPCSTRSNRINLINRVSPRAFNRGRRRQPDQRPTVFRFGYPSLSAQGCLGSVEICVRSHEWSYSTFPVSFLPSHCMNGPHHLYGVLLAYNKNKKQKMLPTSDENETHDGFSNLVGQYVYDTKMVMILMMMMIMMMVMMPTTTTIATTILILIIMIMMSLMMMVVVMKVLTMMAQWCEGLLIWWQDVMMIL